MYVSCVNWYETSTFKDLGQLGEELDATCVTVNGALHHEAVSGISRA